MNPCRDYCYLRFGKQYSAVCDSECDFAKEVNHRKQLDSLIMAAIEQLEKCNSEESLKILEKKFLNEK